MKVDMVMPQMGESIAEGTILKWLKKVGDQVQKDENILEISTDKVDSEIPAPSAGVITELKANEGDVVPVGQVIAVLETEAAAAAGAPAPAKSSPAPAAPTPGASTQGAARPAQPAAPTAESGASEQTASASTQAPASARAQGAGAASASSPATSAPSSPAPASASAPASAPASRGAPASESSPAFASATVASTGEPIPREADGHFFSPLVRSMAREEGLSLTELQSIPGSGRGGRITKEDLSGYLQNRVAAPRSTNAIQVPGIAGQVSGGGAPAPSMASPPTAPMPTMPVFDGSGSRPVRFEPYPKFTVDESRTTPEGRVDVIAMDRMRTLIAEHMVRSKATSPHVASVTEVDMTGIVRYREAAKRAFESMHGVKLTYTPFIVQAAVKALLDYPMMNSTLEEGRILIKRYVHLGVAVALESGLIVPVIKHAEEKNFIGLTRAVDDLAERARGKQLKPDEIQGGTFTVTNMGSFGNLFGIPIINQPQSGILGVGAIVKRPVALGEAIAVRDIMYLSLSYDHRHVDGKLGGLFIQRVRHHLESFDPASV